MILRPYQQRAIESARRMFAGGCRRILLVAPTGSGKTAVGSQLALNHVSKGGSVLWLAHRAELVEQAAASLNGLGLVVGVIGASVEGDERPDAPVQVAMLQTLMARPEVRPVASLLICDEAHHLAAPEWSAVVAHYDDRPRIGLTATPERGDGRGLRGVFDGIVPVASIRELTDGGFLVPCEVLAPAKLLKRNELAQSIPDAFRAYCCGRKTIVFCSSVAAAHDAVSDLRGIGVRAAAVLGETETDERREAIAAFRAGSLDALANVFCLTEGFDAPETSAAIIARGCGSAGMFLQIVGRILRPAMGKLSAVLVDLRGVVHQHGDPDAQRVYSLDGAGISVADGVRFCEVCGRAFESASEPPCGQCGWSPAVGQTVEEIVTLDIALERYASKRAEGDDARARTLFRWIREGESKRYKQGWAFTKYKAVYSEAPSLGVRDLARTLCEAS